MRTLFFVLLIFIYSCTARNNKEEYKSDIILKDTGNVFTPPVDTSVVTHVYNLDSVKRKILADALRLNSSDTLIYKFSFEDESGSEGNEGIAYYLNNKIIKANMVFYREMGQVKISYVFKSSGVKVEEKYFTYKVPIGEVKDDKDLSLENKIFDEIDARGNIVGNHLAQMTDVYSLFKKSVPFELQ